MGQVASWIVFRGLDRAEVAARLDCADAGSAADHKTELALGETPNGRLVVRCRRFDFTTPKRLSALSKGAELVACQIEEHVMVSAGYAFHDGSQAWSVVHDPGKGVFSLMVEGAPPPEFESIRARLTDEQEAEGGEAAGVDLLFDAAPEIVAAVSGYKHDAEEPIPFTELRPIRRGLLHSLFGRR
jgi:hypothetical protein